MVLTVVRNVLRLTSGACVCLIIVVLLVYLPPSAEDRGKG
jgi:hypothetical protein